MKLEELCEICQINEAYLQDLVEYDVITITVPLQTVEFDLDHLNRIKTALRLQRDLEVNMAGAALILDLLDELHDLRARADILERHLLR
jgi:chaperone modulatory protein CbpM